MNIVYLDTCKSTNQVAKEILNNNIHDVPPTVIVSRKQTQGRGRSGNWFSPEDCGIYMSVIRPVFGPQYLHECTEMMTSAVGELLRKTFLLNIHIINKQNSNDIYLGDRKLAGLLCEFHIQTQKLIVGIGINTFRPTKIRKDLVNKITYLNDWAAEHNIVHKVLIEKIAEEILKI